MRDANRLRRLVWNGPAPAGVASRPRTRAASGLRPAANTGCLPGAWLTAAVRLAAASRRCFPQGAARRRRRRRRPPQSAPDAEGERRTARQRAPRLRKEACTYGLTRRLARRPLPFRKGGETKQNSGASAPRERGRLDERSNQRVRRNLTFETETPIIIRTEKPSATR